MTTPKDNTSGSISALVMLTLLMFLWGLANNMTGTMLQNFRHIINMNDIQEGVIKSAFHVAYLFAALPAVIYLYKKHSYRTCILLGLMLYTHFDPLSVKCDVVAIEIVAGLVSTAAAFLCGVPPYKYVAVA